MKTDEPTGEKPDTKNPGSNGYGELNWDRERNDQEPTPDKDPTPRGSPKRHEEAPGRNPAPTLPDGDKEPDDDANRRIEDPPDDREA